MYSEVEQIVLIHNKSRFGVRGLQSINAFDGKLSIKRSIAPVDGPQESAEETISVLSEANPERRLMICDAVIDLAAAFFNVCSKQLRKPGRCVQSISRVRQIAMYISHTGLGLTMTDVGKGFCRDRTTVMHACHQIEDLRDDEEFDHIVEQFNRISIAAFSSFLEGQS